MKVNHVFYGKFHLAGISVKHKEFDRVKDELQVGSELSFLREPDNAFDPYAIQVYYKGYRIGYVEKKDLGVNRKYARLLDAHLTELFYATVASINYKRYEEYWVEVNVFLRLDGTKYYSLTEEEEQMIAAVKDLDLSPILRAFGGRWNTLGKMLRYKNADAAFTCKWELKDILALYDPSPEEPRLGFREDEDDTIGEYFTSYNGKTSSMDEKLVDYPLLCVYLNRIHRHHRSNPTSRMYSICSTFIHECMHALFDHKPDELTHPHDSYLEEPTCECGTIMIAELLEKVHPEYAGFANWALNAVDSKINKYGLGADLYKNWAWPCQDEPADNAVDAYNDACDYIELENGAAVSWTGRMDPNVAIPEMREIYNTALNRRVSNQSRKVV